MDQVPNCTHPEGTLVTVECYYDLSQVSQTSGVHQLKCDVTGVVDLDRSEGVVTHVEEARRFAFITSKDEVREHRHVYSGSLRCQLPNPLTLKIQSLPRLATLFAAPCLLPPKPGTKFLCRHVRQRHVCRAGHLKDQRRRLLRPWGLQGETLRYAGQCSGAWDY